MGLFRSGWYWPSLEKAGWKKEQLRITLGEPRHVYDLRRRRSLGRVKSFVTEMMPHRANFFALLPKPSPAARIVVDKPAAARGELVTARLRVPAATGRHAMRIRAKTPDGKSAEWLDRVILVGRESVEVAIPIAHNDPTGTWSISAIDLYTEKTVACRLIVR